MQEVRKQKEHLQLLNTLDGISDELHSTRKENRDIVLHLNNISENLAYIATYLHEIAHQGRKEKPLDKTTNLN